MAFTRTVRLCIFDTSINNSNNNRRNRNNNDNNNYRHNNNSNRNRSNVHVVQENFEGPEMNYQNIIIHHPVQN